MNHKLDCWKIVAFYELGVGGPFASCTCGVDREQSGDQMSAVAPTNDSQSITPDELRKSCRQVRARPQGLRLDPDVVEAAADEWQDCEERWLKNVEVDSIVIADLRQRLEAARPFVEAAAEEAFTGAKWAELAQAWLDAALAGEEKPMNEIEPTLESELCALLNRYSAENPSDTPDFVLARFLVSCLDAWNAGVARREEWYGRKCGDGAALAGEKP